MCGFTQARTCLIVTFDVYIFPRSFWSATVQMETLLKSGEHRVEESSFTMYFYSSQCY